MNDELSSFIVTDRASFGNFIDLLREDFMENRDTWEHKRIDTFLAAMSRFTEDIQDYYDNSKQKINADNASWKTFADLLKGATIYE